MIRITIGTYTFYFPKVLLLSGLIKLRSLLLYLTILYQLLKLYNAQRQITGLPTDCELHVCVSVPFSFTNIKELRKTMNKSSVALPVSGEVRIGDFPNMKHE